MNCTQKQQLVCFPKVRVYKPWFRHFNDHKDFRNEGTVHLFSLMALFSYANFRSNERVIYGDRYMEAPGQWICKLGALPRILRVHSKAQALELMEYFRNHGFLTFEILDEEKEILRFTIADWKEHCTHLQYNYYSYKGSGFFFFPRPVGRLLLKIARKEVGIVFSELDAIMDMWLHTILNDPQVRGSEYMPVVYYSNMRGMPLLSYTYLARRWGWSKSRVGRFMLKAGEYGIISRVSFSSSRGSVISMCRYREMIYGEGCEELELSRIGEIIGIAKAIDVVEADDSKLDISVESRVPPAHTIGKPRKALRIQVFLVIRSSFFARQIPLVFYSALDWEVTNQENPFGADVVFNANAFVSQYCAHKDTEIASISKKDMEALLTANKDKLYSFAFTDEEREIPPEQGDEDSGETIHETIRIYTISYNGEAYFADQVFHLSDDQKLLASQYAQNLTVLLGDGIYQGLSETEFSAMDLSYDGVVFADGETQVVYYNQLDERWKYSPYGTDTIGGYACGPTAMAIVISSLTSETIDPPHMAQWAYEHGYWCSGNGSYRSLIPGAAQAWSLSVDGCTASEPQRIIDALAEGKLVVALMTKGHFTSSGHFIVLRGCTSDGKILVADPSSYKRSEKSWDMSIILNEASKRAGSGGPFWIIGN